jgi:hypothetical protein
MLSVTYHITCQAAFYVLSGFIQLQLSLQRLQSNIFVQQIIEHCRERRYVLIYLVKPERKIFSQKCEVCLPHNLQPRRSIFSS